MEASGGADSADAVRARVERDACVEKLLVGHVVRPQAAMAAMVAGGSVAAGGTSRCLTMAGLLH